MAKHRAATGNPSKTRSVRDVPAHHAIKTPAPLPEPVTYYPASMTPRAARPVETGLGAWMDGLTAEDAKYLRKTGG